MLVQSLELVEIAISTFDCHALREVCAFFAGRRAVTRTIARASIWSRPFIEHVDATRAHAYLDTAISSIYAHLAIRRTSLLSAGFLPV